MPYKPGNLPQQIKRVLPKGAQTIFLKAFNNAFEKYKKDETAFAVAWTAVKRVYKKNDKGKWVKK